MNEEEEQEYRKWSAEPYARNEQPVSNELNDIPFAVKHPEIFSGVALITIFGVIFILLSVPAGEGGTFIALGGSFLFLIFFLGYYLVVKPSEEYEERKKLTAEAKRKRKNKNTRKRKLNTKERELKKAKRLMEEGGIENLNRAIGILKKYE